jgi:UDP-N-acetylmuramoyl-tripeptide--D-alanyl-D-alanine ligase
MVRTTVIAITGSVGKTTTKECLAAILSPRAPTLKTLNNHNDLWGVPRTILRMRPWHRIAVIEIGTAEPGSIRKSARLVCPDVAIVLVVAPTHTNVFRTLDDTAAEKAHILTAVPRRGLAILNGDDARVRRMADGCRCRVETFGRSAASDLWADQVSSRWPARLTLRAHTAGETQRVETRLVGEHWVNTVLAALLAARSQGVALAAAAETIAAMEPFTARMQPVRLPNGATVIRDEMNSSPDTWRAALEVLRQSSARRRVLVASDVSDSPKKPRVRYKELGDLAAEVADVALFIGGHAPFAVKRAVAKGMAPASVGGVMDVSTAAQRLASLLQDGDVVLLKGRATDHLSRALFAQFGVIGCWTTTCRKQIACDICKELRPEFDLRAAVAGVSSDAPGSRGAAAP